MRVATGMLIRGCTGERPVEASNGQSWRAKEASLVVTSCFVAVSYFTGLVARANNQDDAWVAYLHKEIAE
jgi:hypothetical protein